VSAADTGAGGSRFGSITAKSPDSCGRSKARSTASGVAWIYRCETTMLLCSAIGMTVKASTPDSPSLVSIVWRRGRSTKSAGKSGRRFPPTFWGACVSMQGIDGRSHVGFAVPVGEDKPAHVGRFPPPEHGSSPVSAAGRQYRSTVAGKPPDGFPLASERERKSSPLTDTHSEGKVISY